MNIIEGEKIMDEELKRAIRRYLAYNIANGWHRIDVFKKIDEIICV
jgi:hypothetical protein